MLRVSLAMFTHTCTKDVVDIVKNWCDEHCVSGPFPFIRLFDIPEFDIADVIWSFRAVIPEDTQTRDKIARLFAVDIMRYALYNDRLAGRYAPEELVQILDVAERFALGKATAYELNAANMKASAYEIGVAERDATMAAWHAHKCITNQSKSVLWAARFNGNKVASNNAALSMAVYEEHVLRKIIANFAITS